MESPDPDKKLVSTFIFVWILNKIPLSGEIERRDSGRQFALCEGEFSSTIYNVLKFIQKGVFFSSWNV